MTSSSSPKAFFFRGGRILGLLLPLSLVTSAHFTLNFFKAFRDLRGRQDTILENPTANPMRQCQLGRQDDILIRYPITPL